MSRLPTGTFIPGSSPVHRLDARVKLLSLIALLIAIVSVDTLIGYAVIAATTVFVIGLSGLALKTAVGSAYRMYLFFILVLLMNTCFFSAEDPWFSFWLIHPSHGGMVQGLIVVFRVFMVLVLSNILTCTTQPMEMTNALESLMSPLRFVKIPTDQIAIIISVAIQFIPTLFEEADMIRKAQTARGATFDSPKLSEKAAAVMPLAIPIFLGAFKRADELSLAMEARGYTGVRIHTNRKKACLRFGDYAAMVSVLAVCLLLTAFL